MEVQRVTIPEPLLTCEADPAPPAPPAEATPTAWAAFARDYGAYVVALWSAGQDCRSRLASVRQLQDAAGAVR